MESASLPLRTAQLRLTHRIDWSAVSAWALGFGLVVFLGLEGGGFDPIVHDQVGIAVWWVLLGAVLAGALPRRRPGAIALAALGLLAALVAWSALSLGWSESAEKTSEELARISLYLGVFALALFARDRRWARRTVAAVGAGIAFLAILALLSRLHPGWFPTGNETARFLSERERLSYPLNYWNGLAALIAIGLPLVLHLATAARSVPARAIAAAALPAMALACFLTLSRGGIAAAILALLAFLALTSDRLPKLLTLAAATAGAAVLIGGALERDALQHGLLGATARQQGEELLTLTVVVCVAVGFFQGGLALALERGRRPRWTIPSRATSAALAAVGALALLTAAAAFDAPGRGAEAWREFKGSGGPDRGTGRLASAAGEGRYRYWSAAVRQNGTRPLTGTGAGTFESWWAREGDTGSFVQDAHSLYLQTLGELGIVGLSLLVAFFSVVLVGGARRVARAGPRGRPQLAAALAGCLAFCLTAAVDWTWQVPVLPVAFLLLAAALLSASAPRREGTGLPLPLRVGFGVLAIAAIAAIAVPLASTSLLRESQAEARASHLPAALAAAAGAERAQPAATTPHLQRALLLESGGRLGAAAIAIRVAIAEEPTAWSAWLVRSRIEAKRGRAEAALRAFRRARSLHPGSRAFAGGAPGGG